MFKNQSLYVNGVANDPHQNYSMHVHAPKIRRDHANEVN